MLHFDELGGMELRCGFGGGSGGGGGSGAVDYPTYMKTFHEATLGTWVATNVSDVIDAKMGSSPFAALTPYSPDAPILEMQTAAEQLNNFVAAMGGAATWTGIPSIWNTLILDVVSIIDSSVVDTTKILNVAAQYNYQADIDLNNFVLPRFRKGMQDINVVNSSAFVLGEALIEAENVRNKNKFLAELYLQEYKDRASLIISGMGDIIKILAGKMDLQKAVTQSITEKCRLEIIAKKEQTDVEIHLDELDGKWDLDLFSYAGNMLAAIGSASVRTGAQYNPAASAIGGIMGGVGALMIGAGLLKV